LFPYWAVFALAAFGAVLERPQSQGGRDQAVLLTLVGVFLTLFIGLRYKVGADWVSYDLALWSAGYRSIAETLVMRDPGYEALNWIAASLGLGLWAVDLVCAAIFVWGLLRLARTQPRPWMVVFLAIPYLVTVVAIGYTRQSVAIGIVMASFAAVIRGGSIVRAIVYVAIATLFHRTAIVILPFLSLAAGQSRSWNLVAIVPAIYGLYATFVAPSLDTLVYGYIVKAYSSSGAAIRVGLVVIPAAIFLNFRKRLGFSPSESRLWFSLSLAALACLVLLLVLPSSTVVDRLALYALPLQIVILARVPSTLVSDGFGRAILIFYAAGVLFVWLTFASHSEAWIPYRNYIAELHQGTL
jgi:hypothetical protein